MLTIKNESKLMTNNVKRNELLISKQGVRSLKIRVDSLIVLFTILLMGSLFVSLKETICVAAILLSSSLIISKTGFSFKTKAEVFFVYISTFVVAQYIIAYFDGTVSKLIIFKSFFNSVIALLMFYATYEYGKRGDERGVSVIIFFSLFNALVNFAAWIIQAGAVFGRYNFTSPITDNVTGNIYEVVLAFFICKVFIRNKTTRIIASIVLTLNVIIVMGRAYLLLFFGLYIAYLAIRKPSKSIMKYLFRGIGIVLLIICFFVLLVIIGGNDSFIGKVFNTYWSLYFTPLFDKSATSVMARTLTHQSAVEIFKSHPLFGVGYGLFGYYNTATYRNLTLWSAHSGFYDAIAEFGIIGCFVFLFFFLGITKKGITCLRYSCSFQDKIIYLLLIAYIVFLYVLHNSFIPPGGQRVYYFHSIVVWYFVGFVDRNIDSKC